MIPRSTAIAAAAVILSLLVHFLGLSLTSRVQPQRSGENASKEIVALGSTFEDYSETLSEPVEPETAPTPEPPEETVPEPEPERADTPTSQALVASDNPQRVAAPDTGSAQPVRPETTGRSEPESGEAPTPSTVKPVEGTVSEATEVDIAPPVGTDTVTEEPEGTPDASAELVQPNPVASASEPVVAPAPQEFAALPNAAPVAVPVAPSPEPSTAPTTDPEEKADESVETGQEIISSLRPKLRVAQPPSAAAGILGGSSERRKTRRSSSELIESPLTAYRRDGTDAFAGATVGARSGGLSFSSSRGPGNSDTTNYAGQILVHLNRVPPVAVSARGWVRVFFEINPDGSLAWVDVIDGRGAREVERAAKLHVRNAEPFPRPPEGKSRKLNFVYSID